MESIFTDVRYGVRSLLKRPGATLIALVTLTLGIGVNTAIFIAVDSILLRPLPLKDPQRLVSVWEQTLQLGIQQNEDQVGHDHVVVLSDALRQRRFNRDPSIVNRNITLNGESFRRPSANDVNLPFAYLKL